MTNDNKKSDSKSNDDYISRKKVVFNVDNNNNIPVRLRYKIKNSKDKIKILTDMEDPDYKKEEMNGRNQNLNILLTSVEGYIVPKIQKILTQMEE